MRMWEIREGYERDDYCYRRGGKSGYITGMRHEKSAEEAYECGYEDGYEAAMEEIEMSKSGQRRGRMR